MDCFSVAVMCNLNVSTLGIVSEFQFAAFDGHGPKVQSGSFICDSLISNAES